MLQTLPVFTLVEAFLSNVQRAFTVLNSFLQIPPLVLQKIALSNHSLKFGRNFIAPESCVCDAFTQATASISLTSYSFLISFSDITLQENNEEDEI